MYIKNNNMTFQKYLSEQNYFIIITNYLTDNVFLKIILNIELPQ